MGVYVKGHQIWEEECRNKYDQNTAYKIPKRLKMFELYAFWFSL